MFILLLLFINKKDDISFSGPLSFAGVDFIKKILIKDPNKRMDLHSAY
jgi:hypothetical protein